jgi:phosphate-selective porin OprO/OprP
MSEESAFQHDIQGPAKEHLGPAARWAIAMGLLVLGLRSADARAQTPPPEPAAEPAPSSDAPAPPTPAPADAAAAPVPTPAPPVAPPQLPPDLARRLEKAEQSARITDRKLELLEEKLDASAKEAPVVNAGEGGFFLRSADKRTFVQLRGLLQLDTRWFFNNDAVANNVAFNDNDSILIRRFRPELGGTLVGLADFLFSPDFAGASTTIFDAYVDVHPFSWLRLRVGKQKTPLGLERLQSEGAFPFLERALDQNLTPGRDIGAALWGEVAGGILTYNLGFWDGFPDNSNNSGGASPDGDTDHAKDFIGRILLQPLKTVSDAGALGVGFAVSTGNRKGRPPVNGGISLVPTYRSAGQLSIFTYAVGPATDTTGAQTTFAHLRETHLNPQLYYYYGPFGVLAEAVWAKQGVQRGNSTADLTNVAYHVSANYVLGGKASYDGSVPDHPFDPAAGYFGALEVAARYDGLLIDDATFDKSNPAGGSYAKGYANPTSVVSKAQGWTGAVVYSPSRTLRFLLNYEQTFFTDGGAADPVTKLATDRKTENVLLGRVHVKF